MRDATQVSITLDEIEEYRQTLRPRCSMEKMAAMIGVTRWAYENAVSGRVVKGVFRRLKPHHRHQAKFDKFIERNGEKIRKALDEQAGREAEDTRFPGEYQQAV